MPRIDAHIHLEQYNPQQLEQVMSECGSGFDAVIAVSTNLDSCVSSLALAQRYPSKVYPAFGYHPEQPIPAPAELDRLFAWMEANRDAAIAIGEVGLPYYQRREAIRRGESFALEPYIALLRRFTALAKRLELPIVLHAIREDADIVCDVLEQEDYHSAHFHYFKGSEATARRMAANGYMISITPDVLYDEETRELVRMYPLELMMVETDGPWQFEGPFANRLTTPSLTREVIEELASLRGLPVDKTEHIVYRNTVNFYQLKLE